jgi:hypothetical protein
MNDLYPKGIKRLRWWLTYQLACLVHWLDSWDDKK